MNLEMTLTPTPQVGSQHQEGQVCVANINVAGRRRRLIFGIVQFTITLVVLGGMLFIGLDRLWRVPLLFFFWAAAIGFFEATDKTCVAHASLGTRELTHKIEKVEDQAELSQSRRQARKLMLKSFLAALLLTLAALALP
jgi:hypothetical protein